MKVLHLFDTAGVASVVAKFMDRTKGTESVVVKNAGSNPYYFLLRAYVKAGGFDVVHVHSHQKSVPWLKRFYPDKPIVLTFHGSDLQRTGWDPEGPWAAADALTVVNHYLVDLHDGCAPERVRVIPNAPDTDFFREGGHHEGQALTFAYGADSEAMALAQREGLTLEIRPRGVPYTQMPRVLGSFRWYVDLKRDPTTGRINPNAMSKTALEALACGTYVLNSDGERVLRLPERNEPARVAAEYYQVYRELCE